MMRSLCSDRGTRDMTDLNRNSRTAVAGGMRPN